MVAALLGRKRSGMSASQVIGARIRTARKAAYITQEQLAELAGTSTHTARDIEKGGLGEPRRRRGRRGGSWIASPVSAFAAGASR